MPQVFLYVLLLTATQAYCYEAAGKLTAEPGGRSFAYDAENRLITASVTAGGTALVSSFVYDGQGRRIAKKVGTAETRYLYDGGGNLLVETGPASATAGLSYLTQDALGSTRLVTDGAGAQKECLDYLPFGEEISQRLGNRPACYQDVVYPGATAAGRQEQRFTGKLRDEETGLDYFGARYMSAAQGRFTSADPKMFPDALYDPQSWNKYGYVRNNPLRLVDPNGEDWVDAATGFINAVNSNFALGFGRQTGNSDFRYGQKVGDAVSTVIGGVEAFIGATTTAVGGGACASGVGCPAGLAIAANGVAVAGHGATMTGTALANFMNASDDGAGSSAGTTPEEPPELITNPKHHPNSASPQPSNVKDLFKSSVVDKNGVRWAKDSDGTIHRFSKPSNGQTHWNGSTGGKKPIRTEDIPKEIRRELQ